MKTPDHQTMVANILHTYALSTTADMNAGATWYGHAHTQAALWAREYSVTTAQAAGIIAALSPLTPWARNLQLAELVLSTGADVRIPTLQANAAKARRIQAGDDPWTVLTSQKVRAFFEGILYDGQTDTVCVDRHALSIAYGAPVQNGELSMTPRQYSAYAAAYVDAAAQLGMPGAVLQAITWVAWRRVRGIA